VFRRNKIIAVREELMHAISNPVGIDHVGVMQTGSARGYTRLAICHGEIGAGDEETVEAFVGDLVTISGATWRVVSVHDCDVPSGGPPGSGANQVAVVLEMDPPGPAPAPPPHDPFVPAKHTAPAPRHTWVTPAGAPRPVTHQAFAVDLAAQPGTQVQPQPATRYDMTLPGGVEALCCTNAAGQVCYVETVPGTAELSNPLLATARPDATYVVHPGDGRYAVVLRTDAQARLVEVLADPVPPYGSFGHLHDAFNLTHTLGAWPGQVSTATLVTAEQEPAATSLNELTADLDGWMEHGTVSARVSVAYDGTSRVPAEFRIDYVADGQTTTQTFPNT